VGCCWFSIGICGVGAAYFLPPSPPAERLVGKPAEYIEVYIDVYKDKGKMEQVKWSLIGCAAHSALYLIATAR
jgi:hypothetical protein